MSWTSCRGGAERDGRVWLTATMMLTLLAACAFAFPARAAAGYVQSEEALTCPTFPFTGHEFAGPALSGDGTTAAVGGCVFTRTGEAGRRRRTSAVNPSTWPSQQTGRAPRRQQDGHVGVHPCGEGRMEFVGSRCTRRPAGGRLRRREHRGHGRGDRLRAIRGSVDSPAAAERTEARHAQQAPQRRPRRAVRRWEGAADRLAGVEGEGRG